MVRKSSTRPFLSGLKLSDLGHAAQFVIWSFRAAAVGHSRCPVILNGYATTFRDQAEYAHETLLEFVSTIAKFGRRKIRIGRPGCLAVAADEFSILALLYAAQRNDDALVNAHLSWLTGGTTNPQPFHITTSFAWILKEHGLELPAPDVDLSHSANISQTGYNTHQTTGGHNVRTLH